MTLHTVALSSATPQAWRNGGGVTRELLAWPAADAWRVRVSVADVAECVNLSEAEVRRLAEETRQ